LFARLIYYGVTQLGRNEEDVWLMVVGDLLDQWEIHKQFIGTAKPKVELFIDEVIPIGI
jgi:UDP-2,3-diacylglucosamine pyrophosphatase LpxH